MSLLRYLSLPTSTSVCRRTTVSRATVHQSVRLMFSKMVHTSPGPYPTVKSEKNRSVPGQVKYPRLMIHCYCCPIVLPPLCRRALFNRTTPNITAHSFLATLSPPRSTRLTVAPRIFIRNVQSSINTCHVPLTPRTGNFPMGRLGVCQVQAGMMLGQAQTKQSVKEARIRGPV